MGGGRIDKRESWRVRTYCIRHEETAKIRGYRLERELNRLVRRWKKRETTIDLSRGKQENGTKLSDD
jgi:hypothetical protein